MEAVIELFRLFRDIADFVFSQLIAVFRTADVTFRNRTVRLEI